MSLPATYTRIVLAKRPVADIVPHETFRIEEGLPIADLEPGEQQALVAVDYLSLDPAMRGWLNEGTTYVPAVQIGEIMRAQGLGTVVKVGKGSKFKVGDAVKGPFGWRDYATVDDKLLQTIEVPTGGQLLDFLGPLGGTGMTAYFGLLDVGKPKAGEKLVVSGAAGATGSAVCQIGVLKGLEVYAIAGSAEKCKWLEEELGVKKALNYKDADFYDQFKEHVGTFDIYFDNVGGDILSFLLTRMNKFARIVVCGSISDYNNPNPKGNTGYFNLIVQRARMEGFLVFDYMDRFGPAIKEMQEWIAQGKLKRKYHIVDGLKSAPEALPILYRGGNTGKLILQVSKISEAAGSKV